MDIVDIILLIPVGLLSISFHEYMHGRISYMLGDPTPKAMGRLTLNPLAHLSLVGTLALIIMKIGWAKPVPVNPRYYKNPRKGMMYVGIAGPAANLFLAGVFSILFHMMAIINNMSSNELYYHMQSTQWNANVIKMISLMIFLGILINLALAIFNLLPVPPLDGSKILRGFLPAKFDKYFYKLEGPAGMVVLLVLLYTGIISRTIFPAVNFLLNFLI
ncbi:MAG: site-2 protease family protein [Bacillota bacterium]